MFAPTFCRFHQPNRRCRGLLCILLGASLSVAAPSAEHWAFLPPLSPRLPEDVSLDWALGPVDAFALEALGQRGMRPGTPAKKSTLMRRLSLDLRGLPVSPQEREAFLTDNSLQATERLIDRWLASPHYGERMAQNWLDLARYADTTGHAADQPRTMWLYRDWVIDALNADMPYDQFTVEQLAGDRLPNASEAQRIATGFHRNSTQALGNNPRKEEFRVRGIVDRLDVTGQVWLGLSIACAECHDHKHDPISQREYYQLFAIFNQVPHYGEKFKVHGPRMMVSRVVDGQLQDVQAQVMDELAQPRKTFVHLRGDFQQPGEEVTAALPAVFSHRAAGLDRLGFARWLVADAHPLTARVAVNRAWQHFFGRGLVATANDFGKHGDPPTHPELLDWLAVRFRRGGWSGKRLSREILASAVYRQSSVRNTTRDPENLGLGRAARFRLPAEVIRDQALAVSGLLVGEIGGPSVFPPQPEGVGEFRDATAGQWKESEGAARYRRSLYSFWQRMAPHPALTTFDAPSREWCTVSRAKTNTPLQALAMLNDPAMVEAQNAFADQLERLPASVRLSEAFRRALGREPDDEERLKWRDFFLRQAPEERSRALAAVLFNLDEFLTRE